MGDNAFKSSKRLISEYRKNSYGTEKSNQSDLKIGKGWEQSSVVEDLPSMRPYVRIPAWQKRGEKDSRKKKTRVLSRHLVGI